MSASRTRTRSVDHEAENINDIENYLQSFNKEIGDGAPNANNNNDASSSSSQSSTSAATPVTGSAGNAFGTSNTSSLTAGTGSTITTSSGATLFTIDGAKDLGGIDANTLQMLAEQAAAGDGQAQIQIPTDGDNFQTVAIVPDGETGGYVLFVQPPESREGSAVEDSNDAQDESHPSGRDVKPKGAKKRGRMKIKQERDDSNQDRVNDMSVYDFVDANQGGPGNDSGPDFHGSSNRVNDDDYGDEDEDMNDTFDRVISGSAGKLKPSGVKPKPRKSTPQINASPVKKNKILPITTPSASGAQHMCNYCNYTSNKRYLLSRHMKSHSEERPHKCGICERGFKTIASLQNHVNTHTGVRPHGCKYCIAAFTTSGELVRHVRYRHTHEKPHRCTECDYASVELSKLKRHMRCHTGERPYQCPHCTYASPDTYKLKRHLRIHTGEKPYECDVCHARFTQSNSLKAHRLIHSGNKPVFKCELCPTTCGRKTDLRIHVQKLHTSDKPLVCKRCDQTFPDRYSYKNHLKTHEGEKCFKCDLCSYSSVSARHLESHMLIHTDQKPFQCDSCEQSFRQKQLLKRHQNLYHNPDYVPPQPKEKTHECPHCNKAFRHKGNLMRHLSSHDPDMKDHIGNASYRVNDAHQLIDDEDEEDEEEEDDDEMSQMMPGATHMIIPNSSADEDTLNSIATSMANSNQGQIDPHCVLTFDPQTQQFIQPDGQMVVLEVVQLNNANNDGNDEDHEMVGGEEGDSSFTLEQPVMISADSLPVTSAGRRSHGRGARGRQTKHRNQHQQQQEYLIQLNHGEEVNHMGDPSDNILEEAEYTEMKHNPNKTNASGGIVAAVPVPTPSVVPPPPIVVEDEVKSVRDQLQKQKDLAECFGFRDDDSEDEAILSMPATDAQ